MKLKEKEIYIAPVLTLPMKTKATVHHIGCKSKDGATSLEKMHEQAKLDVQLTRDKKMSRTELKTKYLQTYTSHRGMKQRCKELKIQLASEFDHFVDFLEIVGPPPTAQHTIDRIDSTGPYVPSNVRWATKKEQSRNRSKTVKLTVQGQTKLLVEWAESTGQSSTKLHYRRRKGWPDENIVSGIRPVTLKAPKASLPDDLLEKYTPWPSKYAEPLERIYQRQRSGRERPEYLWETGPRMMDYIANEADRLPPAGYPLSEQEELLAQRLAQQSEMWGTGNFHLRQLLKNHKNLDQFRNLPAHIERALTARYS